MAMNRFIMHTVMRIHRGLFRLTGGSLGARLAGRPMLLLTTTGRKSGKRRVTPLQYMRDGDDLIVVASNGGNKPHPAWWYNVDANSDALAQTGKETIAVEATTANADERARLWPMLVDSYHGYQDYEDETERTIPVVILRPKSKPAE